MPKFRVDTDAETLFSKPIASGETALGLALLASSAGVNPVLAPAAARVLAGRARSGSIGAEGLLRWLIGNRRMPKQAPPPYPAGRCPATRQDSLCHRQNLDSRYCSSLYTAMPDFDPLLLAIPTELRGERVNLCLLRDDDAQDLLDAVASSREHLMPWMLWAKDHVSVDDSLRYIRRSQADWLLRSRLPVGIFIAETGELVGGSGLERIDWAVRSFEIGYWLRADAEGRGYVQECVRLLTRFGFDELRANRVEIRMDPRNRRSERVAQRAGFKLEGTLRNASIDSTGAPADRHIYALTPTSYARLPWAGGTRTPPPR